MIRLTPTRHLLIAIVLVGLGVIAARTEAQSKQDPAAVDSPVSAEQIVADVVKHNELRDSELHKYSSVRIYAVSDPDGTVRASKTVHMEYVAPDSKKFETISEDGSAIVRDLVFDRLMETEAATAVSHERRDSSITSANYAFRVLGQEDVGAYHCYVVEAIPKRDDKYLFRGKIWIDSTDLAVVRIAGHPAKRVSFWVTRADFVRQFEKVGDFWLPSRDETFVDVRFYGKKVLSVEHRIDSVNGVSNSAASDLHHGGLGASKVAALGSANQRLEACKGQCN